MRFRDHSQTAKAEIMLAPLIDVVFILLMFFVVTWNFARQEAEVDISVPKAETAEANAPQPGEIVINVMKNGDIRVNHTTLTRDELLERLKRISAIYPNQPIILRGDNETSFVHIMTVLDTCQKAGIWNVAFAAEKLYQPSAVP